MKHSKPHFWRSEAKRLPLANGQLASHSGQRIDQIGLVRDRMRLTAMRLQRLEENESGAINSPDTHTLKSHYRRKLESDQRLLATLESLRQTTRS